MHNPKGATIRLVLFKLHHRLRHSMQSYNSQIALPGFSNASSSSSNPASTSHLSLQAKRRRLNRANPNRDLTGALGEADDVDEDELEAGQGAIDGEDEEEDEDEELGVGVGLGNGETGKASEDKEIMRRNMKRKGEQLWVLRLKSERLFL